MIEGSKYLHPLKYARRGLNFANRHIFSKIETMLAPDPAQPLRHPPIFFLGAPRSGSTLMIQVITDAFDLGYISNRHCQWFGYPALAELMLHPTKNKPVSNYRSSHGNTQGGYSPAECGEWWYRFFQRRPTYVTSQDIDEKNMLKFRQSIAALTNAFDKPMLFKNLYASLRIQAIAKYIPESIFIITHRDEIDNGHSLLEGRYKTYRNYNDWWSTEPPNIAELKALPAHQQVIEQIRHIHSMIDQDLNVSGVVENRRFHLSYEGFCQDTYGELDKLESFLISNQCAIERLNAVPSSFEIRSEVRIDKKLYSMMKSYAKCI